MFDPSASASHSAGITVVCYHVHLCLSPTWVFSMTLSQSIIKKRKGREAEAGGPYLRLD